MLTNDDLYVHSVSSESSTVLNSKNH
jgi:hypothetical protein